MSSRIRPLLLGSLILAALGVAGCTAGTVEAEPTASVTSSAPAPERPAPTPTPLEPDMDDPTQVALLRINPDGREDYGESIAGPATLVAGQALRIDAWCQGGAINYELRTAGVGDERRVVASGRFPCVHSLQSHDRQSVDAEGPVQLVVTSDGDVATGWVQARVG